MDSGIYQIKNLINNKVYIGSSFNIKERISGHKLKLRKNIHDNIYLQKSYNKYSINNFEFKIIEFCDRELLGSRENYYINLYQSHISETGYNLATVSDSRGNNLTDEIRIKISKSNILLNNNYSKFKLINIETNIELEFDNLVEASRYLIRNGYSKASEISVRTKLSLALRNKKVNNGLNGSIRKTIYKHLWKIIK